MTVDTCLVVCTVSSMTLSVVTRYLPTSKPWRVGCEHPVFHRYFPLTTSATVPSTDILFCCFRQKRLLGMDVCLCCCRRPGRRRRRIASTWM